jgi:hypothetical protein
MPKLQLQFLDYLSSNPKIGIKTNLEGYTLAFRINTELRFGLHRVKEDHSILFGGRNFLFSKYQGVDMSNQASLYLLENRGWSEQQEETDNDLFPSLETSISLTKNRLKPDFILMSTENFNASEDMSSLIQRIMEIKGIQTAFELQLQNLKEEENFILD